MRTLLARFVLLGLVMAAVPAFADILYNNGVVCPGECIDAWTINEGFVVSDTFTLTFNATVTGFDIWTWEYPGDRMLSVQWSITSAENGGTVYGSGTTAVTDTFIAVNEYGFDIDKVTATGLDVSLATGSYWFNLQNAVTMDNDPVYWDENSGTGCTSPGCPSMASDNSLGTIPSETFDINGMRNGTTPEPASLALFASGVVAIAGLRWRRSR